MSSTTSAASNKPPSQGLWSTLAPYLVQPLAAALATVFIFRDLIAKSAQQKGQPIPNITRLEGLKEGLRAGPIAGAIIGSQMAIRGALEKTFIGDSNQGTFKSMLISSAIVGALSAPILAAFNGRTLGWTVQKSLQNLSIKQGLAIALQETAFVAGLSAADRLATFMKQKFGDKKAVEYIAAFTAGSIGSLAGHSANTALTRWQSGLSIDSSRQLMWGSARKAWAIGLFAVAYTVIGEVLNSTVKEKQQ